MSEVHLLPKSLCCKTVFASLERQTIEAGVSGVCATLCAYAQFYAHLIRKTHNTPVVFHCFCSSSNFRFQTRNSRLLYTQLSTMHTKSFLMLNGFNLLLIDFPPLNLLCCSSGAQYVKCRAQRCTEGSRQYLFPGHVDTNSLVVQDEYVFTQVC